MNMLLTVDAGNTNIVFTVFDSKGNVVMESRINTDSARMSDQYAITLSDILRLYGISSANIKGVIISSVVPPVTPQVKSAAEKLFGVSPLVVGPDLKIGLDMKMDNPRSLGSDLVCGAVAAKYTYEMPCIVADLGTVTKVMALDSNGTLIGGVFFPGVRVNMESLSSSTAALPLISVEKTENLICTNTIECMRSGILNGISCMLDGLTARFEREIGKSTSVVTGGHAAQLLPYCERKFIYNPHLVSDGLRIIYNKNTSSAI